MYLYYVWLKIWLSITSGGGRRAIHIPDVAGQVPVGLNTPLLFFAAADSRYFEKFGRSFLGSLIEHQTVPSVHIHLFNPQPDQLGYLQRLAASDHRLRLSFTWEQVDLRPLPEDRRGRYYYSVRFVRMAHIARAAAANCLCLDIDVLLVRPVEQLLAALQDCDVAFYPRFERFGIDTKLLAGTFFIRHASIPDLLLSNIANRISRFVSSGHVLNKLDQIIIYDEYRKLRKQGSGLRFKALDEQVIDTQFTDTGIIWYPKGQSKNDSLYEDERRRYSTLAE
jgi:hypothetical protein